MSEAQSIEVPPRPEDILDEDRIAYQAMSDLSDDDYADLADDIRDRGVLQAILIDENDTILDGHHREAITQHYELSGSKAPSYLRLGDLDDNDEKLARAIKMNLLGRDTDQGVKADAVEKYITRAWTTDDETGALVRTETNVEVGDALGVDNSLVGRVVKDLQSQIIYHDRVKAREYYRDNPDASYRDVAEQVEASRPTVTEWLKEDFDEGEEEDNDDTEQQPLNMLARNQSEVEQTRELANRVRDEDEDDEVQETTQEVAEKVAAGETTPDRAHETVEDAIEEREREQTVESISESVASDSEEEDEESIDVSHGDVWELGDHILYCGDTASEEFQSLVENAAFAFADPPYAAGVAEWDDDESEAFDWEHDWLHDVSDIVAVTPGIVSIFDFAQRTTMPYRWSIAAWIKNGGARGELGFGNWIYTAIFADEDVSLYRTSQDVIRITLKASENDLTEHKGRKPSEFMAEVVGLFSEEGETIIDPFAGSGATLFAAEEMGRTCITGDLEPEFCEEIITRWDSLSEKEAAVHRGGSE